MGHTLLRVLELFLLNTLLCVHAGVSSPSLTLEPSWSQIFRGETITFRCQIQGGGSTDWTYEWTPARLNTPSTYSEYRIIRATEYDSGEYRCKGRRGSYSSTEWSDPIKLTVSSEKPEPTLTALPTIIPIGGSVRLTCSVEGSAGWKYEWFKRTADSYGVQPIKNSGPDNVTHVSEGGRYHCRGGRGHPLFFTQNSNEVTIQKIVSKASLTLEPNWSQIFRGETITLRCQIQGGGGTDWTYDWRIDSSYIPSTYSEYRIRATESYSGDYWCMGRRDSYSSTEWSDPIKLTVSSKKPEPTLTADKTIIPIGGTVRLTCSVEGSAGWKYDWFKSTADSSGIQYVDGTDEVISVSGGGLYHCRGGRGDPLFYTEASNGVTIQETVSKASLTLEPSWSQIFRDETITLRCQIQGGGGTYWTYEWEKDRSYIPSTNSEYRISSATESDSGEYRCMGRRDLYSLTAWSNIITLTVSSNRPKAELSADDRDIPVGGSVTLTCSVKPSSPGWKYTYVRGEKPSEPLTTQDVSLSTGQFRVSQEGVYWCRGGRGNPVYYTEYSDSVSIKNAPLPVLTVSPSWLNDGDSVTLNCEVEHPSAGWSFYWYKAVPIVPGNGYSSELLPGSINGTEQDSYIVHGQTGTARYECRAGRGDPVYYTQYSKPQFVWSGDLHSSASLTVSPDRVQHFTSDSDSVSLTCEGNSTEWRVRGLGENSYLSSCSPWGTMTGSTCNMYSSWQIDGVFWCESGSGEFSNAVNISTQDRDITLVSPVRPVTEGDPVSLSCKLRTERFVSDVFFYRNDELIQNDTRQELNISAVSKSDEGFYKCQHSGEESSQSWMSVQAVSRPESSSVPVGLIVGLVCGIVLLLLLLFLLYRYRPSKNLHFIRQSQSEGTNQGFDMVNQNEAEGGAVVYESIKGPEDTETAAGGSQDVTYSLIELKNIKKKGTRHEPEESSVYSDVKTRTADDNLMYAQVNYHDKGNTKKTKGTPRRAATDEAVYSEVKPGRSLGL